MFRSALPKSYRTNKIEATPVIDEWCTTFRDQVKCRDDNEALSADLLMAPSQFLEPQVTPDDQARRYCPTMIVVYRTEASENTTTMARRR